ncbi:MAG TPA: hypothetical protein VGO06_18845 [Bosea sp. (in: a-proteobacteria)]|uniref:hypothetical protein n=1 Tax=Bosea sp. (in: a-proteobacteria) TaxID=1871050 RepID=UPI002E0D702F|nr:hypothetical protein [Bosea sp. (in: a-proteobacteria)]
MTNKRAVIAKSSSIKSFAIQNIAAVEFRGEAGELGDLLFFETQVLYGESTRTVRDGFIGIAGAEAVAREMRRLQSLAAA